MVANNQPKQNSNFNFSFNKNGGSKHSQPAKNANKDIMANLKAQLKSTLGKK